MNISKPNLTDVIRDALWIRENASFLIDRSNRPISSRRIRALLEFKYGKGANSLTTAVAIYDALVPPKDETEIKSEV